MKLKSKSKMFRTLVEKMDIALSEGSSFDEIWWYLLVGILLFAIIFPKLTLVLFGVLWLA